MKLSRFMDDAYQGTAPARRLKTQSKSLIFSLEDLADLVGSRPRREDVEQYVSEDRGQIEMLLSVPPARKHALLWGYLSALLAERCEGPLKLPGRDYAGLEMRRGWLVLEGAGSHLGERMSGGRIMVQGSAGECLGQEMTGGGIIAAGCSDYAFRNMRAGFGLIRGDAGKFTGLGNRGGRIVVQGSCAERAGWLMHSGSLYVRGDAGEYLGLLMSGGRITVRGRAGRRAGWRKKGGLIAAAAFGPEAAEDVSKLELV
jgi:formylmethanofuran dehydrogenase subunit C